MCYKVNDAKTFKNLVYYFMLAHYHVYCRLARLTGPLKLNWFSAVNYRVSLEGYQTICVGSFSFAKGQQGLSKV